MTNTAQANRLLAKAEEELGRMKVYATARAAVYTGMALVAVAVDVGDALRAAAKAQDRIASVINQGRSWH